MDNSHIYDKIKEDFNNEASKPNGMFSKQMTQADTAILEYLKKIVKPHWKCLSIGCGTGNIIEKLNCEAYGIDISSKMLEKCDLIQKSVGNMDDLMFGSDTFDLVYMAFVLQQSENPLKTLNEAYRVSKNLVIVFDGDKSSSIGQLREKEMAKGTWPTCGKAQWFTKNFFTELGWEADNLLPHVLVAKIKK